jgi:Anti-sigma-D factor RsdA to sigma factor binding region
VRQPRNGENRSGGKHPFGHDHSRTNGTNGARPAGMSTHTISLHDIEDDDEPVDLVALQADDELINALASGLSVSGGGSGPDTDDTVAAILASWKAEVDAEPIPDLVDLDTAVATLQAARRPSGRARHLVPVAAAAAGLVILLGGVSLGSYSAQPEDTLWPVAKVLFAERADSVEAAGRVEERIARAKRAIAAGQPALAEQELKAAAADLAVVRPEEGRTELVEVQAFLAAKAEETPPGVPTDPGAPLAGDQTRRVPLGAQITSPAARTSEQQSPTVGSPDAGSSGSTSPQQERPAAPAPVDPRILLDAPAPVGEPEVSTAPSPDSPPPAKEPSDGKDGGQPPAEEEQPPAQAPPAGDGDAVAPDPAPQDSESIGATAADSDPTAPSPTS